MCTAGQAKAKLEVPSGCPSTSQAITAAECWSAQWCVGLPHSSAQSGWHCQQQASHTLLCALLKRAPAEGVAGFKGLPTIRLLRLRSQGCPGRLPRQRGAGTE